MAGENVVASGAIAVNLTLNDPQGAFTGGATPGAPGAGAIPPSARKGEYAGYLSSEQKEGLKVAREERAYLKELADYNKLVKGELPEDKAANFSIKKFLPMLGGALGIATIAQHSIILSQSMGALFKILGAFADLLLMPFFPLIAATLSTLANIVSGVAEVMKDPKEFVKAVWGRIEGYGEVAWNVIKNDALEKWKIITESALKIWGSIETVAKAAWNLLPTQIQTFISDIISAIGKAAEGAWKWISEKFEKYFPWLKDKEEKKKTEGEIERPGELYKHAPNTMKWVDEQSARIGEALEDFFKPIGDFLTSPGFKWFMTGAAGGGTGGATAGTLGGPIAPITVPLLGILGSIFGGLVALATLQELESRKNSQNITNNVAITIGTGLSAEEEARRLFKLLHDGVDERYP